MGTIEQLGDLVQFQLQKLPTASGAKRAADLPNARRALIEFRKR
jgi:hypothetical protein